LNYSSTKLDALGIIGGKRYTFAELDVKINQMANWAQSKVLFYFILFY